MDNVEANEQVEERVQRVASGGGELATARNRTGNQVNDNLSIPLSKPGGPIR